MNVFRRVVLVAAVTSLVACGGADLATGQDDKLGVGEQTIVVCDGIPPLGYALCDCEETEPYVWTWVCDEADDDGQNSGGGPPTSDE